MNIQTAGTGLRSRIVTCDSKRGSFTEYHVTGTADAPGTASECAVSVFEGLADSLVEHEIQPIQEKLYGLSSVKEEVLHRREEAWVRRGLDPSTPVTWIEGRPPGDTPFVGAQIWGIASHRGDVAVRSLRGTVAESGRCWTGRGFRMIHLPSVHGCEADGSLPPGHARQAELMFTNAGAALKAHGLSWQNVVRTWIYLPRLLDWYGDLNRVRTRHFAAAGVGGESGTPFPASTGIQGRHGAEECFMDVLALESTGPGGAVATPIRRSPRQDQSFSYGSAFSRGMTIAIEDKKTIHISGTASINRAGASTHIDDAEGQSLETLMSIAAILEEQGGGLHNITSSTLFCKTHEAYEAWMRVTRLLGVPDFPCVRVLADVCRPDLLVEMEAVAVI